MTIGQNFGRMDGGAFVTQPRMQATGLTFPSNSGTDANTVRFDLSGSNCPTIVPLTVVYRYRPVQQTGYYSTFFWANRNTDFINQVKNDGYFGTTPYPQDPGGGPANGTVHNWAISIEGNDFITDDNGNSTVVVKDGTWYQQAAVATQVNTDELRVVFYWNLSVNSNRVITFTTTTNVLASHTPPDPALMWGDAYWNPGDELLSGTVRAIQVFQSALTLNQINVVRQCNTDNEALIVAASLGLSHWYLNMNPTPTDVTDKSGNGRNPSWANSNRPTLSQGSV